MHKILTILLLILVAFTPLFSINYYVSPTGNNANAGTQALPWKTIQHACNNATPGSTVYIMAGTYTESIWTNVNGTAGNYITFTHFGSDIVTIDGGSTNTQTVLWTLDNTRYIRIDGLHFANAMGNFSMGINVRNGSDHIEILNNEVYNINFSTNPNATVTFNTNTNPIVFYGNHPTIPISSVVASGNIIRNCRTGASEALTATGDVNGFTFSGNTIHDITNIGIDAAGGHAIYPANPTTNYARNGTITDNLVYNCVSGLAVAAGIYADGSRNVLIEHNTVHDCGRGFEVGCEIAGSIADNVIVRNNITYHNREAAIGIGGYNYPSTGKVTNSQILHNTCYDNVWENPNDGDLLIEYTENCTIKHNLFHTTNAAKRIIISRLNSTGLTLNYNLYYHSAGTSQVKIDWNGTIHTGFTTYKTATGKDQQSVFGNPLMVLPASQNFHLGTGSPAYNAGDPAFAPSGGEMDIDGDNRLLLGRVDIGADESSIVLPVTYQSPLIAYPKEQYIELTWATATESGASHFELERSSDGYSFEKIGTITARGYAVTNTAYTFIDRNPIPGFNYYRLRQVDLDGKSWLSPIAAVLFKNTRFKVFPNPSSAVFNLEGGGEWAYIVVYNQQGQAILQLESGAEINLSGLPIGRYTCAIYLPDSLVPQMEVLVKK